MNYRSEPVRCLGVSWTATNTVFDYEYRSWHKWEQVEARGASGTLMDQVQGLSFIGNVEANLMALRSYRDI